MTSMNTYLSPSVEIIEICQEGALCQSVNQDLDFDMDLYPEEGYM